MMVRNLCALANGNRPPVRLLAAAVAAAALLCLLGGSVAGRTALKVCPVDGKAYPGSFCPVHGVRLRDRSVHPNPKLRGTVKKPSPPRQRARGAVAGSPPQRAVVPSLVGKTEAAAKNPVVMMTTSM